MEEYKQPPTYIEEPKPKQPEPEAASSENTEKPTSERLTYKKRKRMEKLVLIKIYNALRKNGFGMIPFLAEPKVKEDGTKYWDVLDESEFIELMDIFNVFKRFSIGIRQKDDV